MFFHQKQRLIIYYFQEPTLGLLLVLRTTEVKLRQLLLLLRQQLYQSNQPYLIAQVLQRLYLPPVRRLIHVLQ
jgi:hypothetical protein